MARHQHVYTSELLLLLQVYQNTGCARICGELGSQHPLKFEHTQKAGNLGRLVSKTSPKRSKNYEQR